MSAAADTSASLIDANLVIEDGGDGGADDIDDDGSGRGDGEDPGRRAGVGSWLKWIVLGVAFAVLVGAFGYVVGERRTAPAGNAVDVGFLRDMTDHHDQAVLMAQSELAHGSDPVALGFAMEIIMFQRLELGRFQNFQDDLGATNPDHDPDRTTMEWMGMPTPLRSMPGMATDEQLAQLDAARGTDADRLFLTLMQAHHLGGAHMSDYEADSGANPALKELAGRMARNQRIEVKEYQGVIDRLDGKAP